MELQKYSVNQMRIETLLTWVQTGEIAMKPADPKALESESDRIGVWSVRLDGGSDFGCGGGIIHICSSKWSQ